MIHHPKGAILEELAAAGVPNTLLHEVMDRIVGAYEDLNRDVVEVAVAAPLEIDPDALDRIRDRIRDRGRPRATS